MIYRIFPPIGIARLGNSISEFFIGPETPGSPGTELKPDGTETAVVEYKTGDTGNPATSYQVKRQAARFRIYEFDDAGGGGKLFTLPAGARIEWSVRLVNKKDAVVRGDLPPAAAPTKVDMDNARLDRMIDSGVISISGSNQAAIELRGMYLGAHPVSLGMVRTDPKGNLLVLGGTGVARSYEGVPLTTSFYNHPGWHDDVGDGPVTASVILADGTRKTASPAWVVVGPPDFAPNVQALVTLYDRILDSAVNSNLLTLPATPSFTGDILPLIRRTRGLRWVHDEPAWKRDQPTFAQLSDSSDQAKPFRNTAKAVMDLAPSQGVFSHPDYKYKPADWHNAYLKKFVDGQFLPDFIGFQQPDPTLPEILTKTVLSGTVGEGLYPGIEGGRILTNMSLYSVPFEFRLDHSKIDAGDVTALMAQPWQADFAACDTGWWPTQRPNLIPQTPGPRPEWDRGLHGYEGFIGGVMRLGVITRRPDDQGKEVQEESRRDPTLPAA